MTTDTQLHAIAEAFRKVADSQVAADAEIAQALNRGFWSMFDPGAVGGTPNTEDEQCANSD